tara:strand:+ start:47 stop:589 length:543 start_codon:yes stop_codon:yes gene_type:complete
MNFIYKIPKAYSKNSCNKLINWFEEHIDEAKPGGAEDKKINDLEINLEIKNKEDYFGLDKTLLKSITNFKNKYSLIDKHIGKWAMNRNVALMKYEPNNYYDIIHCENSGKEKHLKRVFAFMIFLNDIKKGGGTKFLFQKFIAKPKAGDFYIWPAYWTHLHQGINAPKENKYIITGWVDYI